jgi:site-specific DNA-methyltransferase (adenine-specific)
VLIPLIEAFSRKGGVVLDPFSGSGSSLVAAKLLGRKYLGIDIEEQFQLAATDRLEGYVIVPAQR